MKGTDPKVLLGELEKGMEVSAGTYLFFEQCLLEDVPKLGRNRSAAVLLAGIIDNYYTGLETMFFRISQFFENSLSKDRWHSDLLQRMCISIKDERVKVIKKMHQVHPFVLVDLNNFIIFLHKLMDPDY